MNDRLNWMHLSVSAGRLFSTHVRLSIWLAIVPLVVCPRYGFTLGMTFSGLLLLSVLLHEFAHVFTARWTGGRADEVLLTPVGGLAQVSPARGAFGMGLTAAAGPALNLLICLFAFPGWYAPQTLPSSLNPFVLPIGSLQAATIWQDIGLLLFTANWIGLLVNLLPVLPLDGGHILRAALLTRIAPEFVNRTAINIGIFVAMLILIGGASFDNSQVVLIGTFVLTMNLIQYFQLELAEALDAAGPSDDDLLDDAETLERSNTVSTRESLHGPLESWREQRRVRREQLEQTRQAQVEEELDSLLAKVHEHGLQSLSEQEKNSLKSCSDLLRERSKHGD
ncbi:MULTISPECIES: site-2 protease family protein [unclassified Schlesneria]|uniref:site-2 protease family protein n=1 Tax=unclassified Schlesneria TaxID=2762017 RepID=UPI002F088F3C